MNFSPLCLWMVHNGRRQQFSVRQYYFTIEGVQKDEGVHIAIPT